MTDHPCSGLPPRCVEIFEMVAINLPAPQVKTHIAELIKRGLIVENGTRAVCRDRFGTVEIPDYSVPLPIHMQWCQWASEQQEIADA